MKKIKKLKIKSYYKSTGKLIPLSFNKKFPFKVKRIFFIYGKNKKERGNHAHKKAYQFFFPVHGKMRLKIRNSNKSISLNLNSISNEGYLVPPGNWCTIKFVNNNSILLVLSNRNYEKNDYIRNFKKYLNFFRNKK